MLNLPVHFVNGEGTLHKICWLDVLFCVTRQPAEINVLNVFKANHATCITKEIFLALPLKGSSTTKRRSSEPERM